MVKVINKYNAKNVLAERGKANVVQIFQGDKKSNFEASQALTIGKKIVTPYKKENWSDSADCARLYDDIESLQKKMNAAQAPTTAQIEAILGKMFIDITRRAQEAGDLTSFVAREITDLNADKTVTVRDILKYRGKFKVMSGANDSVPLIEQALGNTDTFALYIRGLGWKDSLANMLYNRLHEMEKVNTAAAEAHIDVRNAQVVGRIANDITFVASMKQAADTAGGTFDMKMYNTIRKAIKKLRGLKDTQTDRKIAVPSISILCNSNDTWDIERVINGQLTNSTTGVLTTQNAQALPIANILEYDQGISDGFTWGKETLSYPGVTQGKCYVFVPNEYWQVLNKRPLTLETGVGSTLQLSTEERAWYSVFGQYDLDFFGASHDVTAAAAGYGSIIEISLPTDS